MSLPLDAGAVAARLRSVLPELCRGKFEGCARTLGVSEVALRMSIDPDEPHPTLEVLAAVVQQYGVDPCWLVSGEYDPAAHRAAISDGADADDPKLLRLVAAQMVPRGTPPEQQDARRLDA